MTSEFGALSLVPPLLAIALAIVTRRALLSLFIGIWAGGAIIAADGAETALEFVAVPFVAVVEAFGWIVASYGDDTFHAEIIAFTFLLGAGIALVWRMGGSVAVAQAATTRVDSHRRVGLAAWLLGLVWFFDDYANTAIVGSAVKDIADEVRMSREKLAYILDSTAAPVATFGISSWVAFQIGLIQDVYDSETISGETPSAVGTFLWSIPFNVYCLLALLMVLIIVLTRRDFGEMLDAETRAQRTGKVTREDATPLQSMKEDLGEPAVDDPLLRTFVVPVAVLVTVVIGGATITGFQAAGVTPGEVLSETGALIDLIDNTDFTGALVWGSFSMVATAVAMALYDDVLTLEESMETIFDGFGIMLTAVSILVMAWSIGTVAEVLETGRYVTALAEGIVTPTLLPVVVLLSTGIIAFSIGTSWGTMGIVTPIAVPMAYEIGSGSPELLSVAVGAIFSGAIFGDHCSPISDTTILSSTFAGADHIDHVRTQLYYALTVLAVSIVVYLLYGLFGLSPFVLVPIGAVVLVGLVYALSELDAARKNLVAKPFAGAGERDVPSDD
ncbi:Na+/H+ antiporter NhaC family protein [Natrialba asiatica]|uniref:Na+/H+ antiporter NhaC n=1 Tax=Natrialba asiatica (strain ATCC 700177 / DSM 12278 / JCM 9576 / FERM P-10747 / NBRC 102637 / 172P1) TaxID=29540 RepID=M0AIJ2_NATA1|nr:Na+/H+ antiporter NhaC family protein [Natrialba asiatica]ELY98490.1 Na+/H+ antiporter NhaC [Natrialba asiatica DSM 12278]